MKHRTLLFAIPAVAAIAIAMAPQGQGPGDPTLTDVTNVLTISELQYTTFTGQTTVVSARNVVEIRLIEDVAERIRLELYYENGDYSLIDAQAFHLLRSGQATREVKVIRGKQQRMRFPAGIQ